MVRDKFPDLVTFELQMCICGHSDKYHFALGCCKCHCSSFITWEEYDAKQEKLPIQAKSAGEG